MITQEIIELNGKQYMHTHSDTYMIMQIETGSVYADAMDIIPCAYTYEETEEMLPFEEMGLQNPFDNEEPIEAEQ